MKVGLHPFFRIYFHLGANENKRFNSFLIGAKKIKSFCYCKDNSKMQKSK